jgi:hypothetical protein
MAASDGKRHVNELVCCGSSSTELTDVLFLSLARERLTTSCPLASPPALPVETTHGKLASAALQEAAPEPAQHSSTASAELCASAKDAAPT